MTRKPFVLTAAVVTFLATLTHGSVSSAAEIKVIGSAGVTGPVDELGRQFAAATGHKVMTDYEVIAVLKRRIDAGEVFDIAILSPEAIDELIRSGKIAADARTSFGRAGLAVGARKGAPKPDVSSVEAFKRTMLNARLVSYSKEGLSGVHFLAILARLGIVEDMRLRIKAYETSEYTTAVAKGEAELIVTAIAPLLAEPGIEIVGVLPPELQTYVHFTAGVSAAAKEPQAAKSFIRFPTSPAAAPVLKAKGLEPD